MIFIVIPIFNEAKNLQNLFNEITSLKVGDYFLVFADDGSIDNSVHELNNLFGTQPHVILVSNKNYGPGDAFNRGLDWVLSNSVSPSDIVVTMEADCTSDLTLLPKMIEISKLGFELVLASVNVQGGGFSETTLIRRLLSGVANLLFRFMFKLKVQTISSFYRVYNIELLNKIKTNDGVLIGEKGFLCMLEILLKSIKLNANIIEVPMILKSNKRIGKSKMPIMKTTFRYLAFLVKQN
jgi:dolichol-phosphate mannosyltransferase